MFLVSTRIFRNGETLCEHYWIQILKLNKVGTLWNLQVKRYFEKKMKTTFKIAL